MKEKVMRQRTVCRNYMKWIKDVKKNMRYPMQ